MKKANLGKFVFFALGLLCSVGLFSTNSMALQQTACKGTNAPVYAVYYGGTCHLMSGGQDLLSGYTGDKSSVSRCYQQASYMNCNNL